MGDALVDRGIAALDQPVGVEQQGGAVDELDDPLGAVGCRVDAEQEVLTLVENPDVARRSVRHGY